jgi:precorrin-6B methylase 1
MTPGERATPHESNPPASRGRLVIVGSGIELGRHMGQRTESEIRRAEVVFCMVGEFALAWLQGIRPDVISLHDAYGEEKDRRQTYREMETRILAAVREGRHVCAVFYGHPGIFADVPHETLRKAGEEGHDVRMEPGISAEACLYADLRVDPGHRGVQSFEATQFLVFQRRIDPTALLILWQVALSGDLSCTRFDAEQDRLQVLVDKLAMTYPLDTEVILYEAAQLPIEPFRADRMPLQDLPKARFKEYTTLVIPPAEEIRPDRQALAALGHGAEDLGGAWKRNAD